MSRATFGYVVALVVCVVGVFVILERGTKLTAPPDLSGEWQILDTGGTLGETLIVHQSGQFIRLNFQGGLKLNVKMVSPVAADKSEAATSATTRRAMEMKFVGDGWTLTALGAGAEGPLICRLAGPEDEHHGFTVTRPILEEPTQPDPLADASPSNTVVADAP